MRLPFLPWSIAGVPSSQALPDFLITASPPVCVPEVLGALAAWIQNQNKIKSKSRTRRKRTTHEKPPTKLINCGGGSSGGVLFLRVLDQGT